MNTKQVDSAITIEIDKLREIAAEDARLTKENGIDLNPFSLHGSRHLWQQGWNGVRPDNLVDGSGNWRFWERGRQAKLIAQHSVIESEHPLG